MLDNISTIFADEPVQVIHIRLIKNRLKKYMKEIRQKKGQKLILLRSWALVTIVTSFPISAGDAHDASCEQYNYHALSIYSHSC